jgi:hypothetical protein
VAVDYAVVYLSRYSSIGVKEETGRCPVDERPASVSLRAPVLRCCYRLGLLGRVAIPDLVEVQHASGARGWVGPVADAEGQLLHRGQIDADGTQVAQPNPPLLPGNCHGGLGVRVNHRSLVARLVIDHHI